VLDEERVERDPEPRVDGGSQSVLGLLGGAGAHDPEPVRDPVDVGVDGHGRDPVAEDEDAVRGLRADPGEARERLKVPRHLPPEPVEESLRAAADPLALRTVEADGPDQALDLLAVGPCERPRVREPLEQPCARDVRLLVPRALGEDRADQHLERVLGVVPEVRTPPVPGAVELGEPVEGGLPREAVGGPSPAHSGLSDPVRRAGVPGSP
jgi:hypothetical protein